MSYLFDQMKAELGKATTEDKILLMGLQQAGKTAIKDVVFFGKQPGEVEDYMATIHYERQFLDEEKKSLIIDSGGQESYWNEAVTHCRHLVFSNVNLLVWVVDLTRPDLFEESERRFSFTIRQFKKENPDGYISVLCHKVDMITPEELVPLLEHIKDTFKDPKYEIRFEASSIYYTQSLKDLVFHLMKEANMNIERFELITSISKKIEESDEFQSFMVQNKGDPRVKELLSLIDPEPEASLPTYGKVSLQFDLSAYDIIEIVLIDKGTLSPIIGTSSPSEVSVEKSMDYIIALQEFKKIITEKKEANSSQAFIATSSNEKVHAMIFNLEENFLLITSFSKITQEKTKAFYQLLNEFTQKIDVKPVVATEPIVASEIDVEPKIPFTPPVVEVEAPIIQPMPQEVTVIQNGNSEIISIDNLESEEKSVFSFLNKLKEEKLQEIEEEEEERIEAEVLEAPIPTETEIKLETEPIERIEPSTDVEAPIIDLTQEIIEDVKPPITEEMLEEEKQVVHQSPFVQMLKEEEKVISEKIDDKTEDKKPKSKFLQRLQEEEQRYKIKQVKLDMDEKDKDAKEHIHIDKDQIAHLAEYLKEKSSEQESEES
ncbi:MAG: hypothetical protein FK731_08070 [Asgard group archaeon]|nr:hypothetical protein [Asgard group archaeon]